MTDPAISVIVPVYKTEKTLNACVDSILRQTFSDLELILVEDGSPDPCPALCDTIAQTDARVRAIHKSNGGLSDARNRGIEAARGTWLAFVDSDDTIGAQMLEHLWNGAVTAKASMSICAIREVDAQGKEQITRSYGVGACSAEETMKRLLQCGGGEYAVNKLYHRELFETVRFPVGKRYEDKAVFYRLLDGADRVFFTDYVGYFYYRHENTITYSSDIKAHMEALEAQEAKWAYIRVHMPQLEPLEKQEVIQTCGWIFERIYEAKTEDFKEYIRQVREVFRRARSGADYPRFSNRVSAFLMRISPWIYAKCCGALRRRGLL